MLQMPDARIVGRIADAVILVTWAGPIEKSGFRHGGHRLKERHIMAGRFRR